MSLNCDDALKAKRAYEWDRVISENSPYDRFAAVLEILRVDQLKPTNTAFAAN